MVFEKDFHHILPLVDGQLSTIDMAKAKCLPPVLHINLIAELLYPDIEKLQKAALIKMKKAIKDRELSVVTVEEWSQLIVTHEQSRDPGKFREPRSLDELPEPPIGGSGLRGYLPALTCIATGYSETDLLPANKGTDNSGREMYIVHRDEMKKWLETEGEWPLEDNNLLSNWWPQVEAEGDVGGTSLSKEVKFDRVSVNDLIDALDEDPIYSVNKRAFLVLREILPENDMPPLMLVGHRTYSHIFVLTWAGYCKPPLKIYLPGKNESHKLDWQAARKFTDYRLEHGYRIEETGHYIKFGDLEIDLEELRHILFIYDLCLPTKLYPRDPANCQCLFEIEESDHRRIFQEEIQFSELLRKLQEDVIEAVENRNQQPEIEFNQRALQALDALNELLLRNERTSESQRKSCLSDECLEAIDYIELRCCPVVTNSHTADNIFRKEGVMWTLSYKGKTTNLKPSKGLQYISYLLGTPFEEYPVAVLVKAAENPEKEILSVTSGEVGSLQTILNYRKRLAEIRIDLIEAESNKNQLELEELLLEKEALEKQMKQAVGFGGKLKKFSGENKKQAKAVSEAITRCMKVIQKNHPSLWQHLYNAISRGEYLAYNPETNISWITSQ